MPIGLIVSKVVSVTRNSGLMDIDVSVFSGHTSNYFFLEMEGDTNIAGEGCLGWNNRGPRHQHQYQQLRNLGRHANTGQDNPRRIAMQQPSLLASLRILASRG